MLGQDGSVPVLNRLASLLGSMQLAGQEIADGEGGFVNTRILFVFDGFTEHVRLLGKRPENQHRQKFSDLHVVDSLETLTNVQMALRVYGHQSPVVFEGLPGHQTGGYLRCQQCT